MALMIGEECIACEACVQECPNKAIQPGEPVYIIDPGLCTECLGSYDEPRCAGICPVDCIQPDPDHQESEEEMFLKYHRFHLE